MIYFSLQSRDLGAFPEPGIMTLRLTLSDGSVTGLVHRGSLGLVRVPRDHGTGRLGFGEERSSLRLSHREDDGTYSSPWVSFGGSPERIDGLSHALTAKRNLWKTLHPGGTFPGAVVLQIDAATRSGVVKSVFQTAALAGYPSESFMVKKIGH